MIINKKDKRKMADMMSEMLTIGGRLMTCIEEMEESDEYGERGRYGMRDGMGMRDGGRYGNRWDEYDRNDWVEHRSRRY